MSKEIKNEFIKLDSEGNEKQAKFLNSYYADVIKIGNFFLPIEKQTIKKDFCFGAGQNGVTSSEDWDNANNMSKYAKESEQYFISENLEDINGKIACLKYFLNDFKDWIEEEEFFRNNQNRDVYHLTGQKIYLTKTNNDYEILYAILDNRYFEIYNRKILRQATKSDIQAILTALEEEKKSFTKRLQTYLKKYGLSKIRTWTYICD